MQESKAGRLLVLVGFTPNILPSSLCFISASGALVIVTSPEPLIPTHLVSQEVIRKAKTVFSLLDNGRVQGHQMKVYFV